MNSCILMAEIIDDPQLRYTPDGLELTEMMVQFPGLRQEDPAAMLRVVSWGNTAKDVKENYHKGDRVILEGRLGMNTIQHREGFKEKKAELTIQRIYAVGAGFDTTSSAVEKATAVATSRQVEKTVSSYESPLATPTANNVREIPEDDRTSPIPQTTRYQPSNSPLVPEQEPDMDDIPFVRSVDSRTASFGLLDFYEIESQCPQVGISHNFKFI